ncbi:glycosyltransferase [Luteibacter aegosomatis]|uniref:glycosyltransferase n=1 Tax=Luteibacter aegosomatis TaxID=2911537 RepID=UPI001FFB41FF|nr:glycosyltransferase [Luteibacter aegosomatis]UPG87774.1 glycosyltransferase [Luteibacter aegosomatis]
MSEADVRLSIIIITWNERENLERCLLSLMDKVDFERDEVIVVDNGSRDGSAEFVATLPRIRYFPLEHNHGVGPARNRGLFLARGKYCMTLDNDTIFLTADPGAIVEEFFRTHPDAGVVGFQLLNVDRTRQDSTRRFPRFYQPIAARIPASRMLGFVRRELERHLMLDTRFDESADPMEVDYVLGANQTFTKDTAARLMGYDDRIFFGPEDAEFCVRTRKLGLRNYYSRKISVVHDYKRRTRKFSRLTLKHLAGFAYMLRKHGGVYRYSLSERR